MPEHVDITDPNIHEPRGISNSAAGEVYVSDGTGSGDWSNLTESTASYFEGGSQTGTPTTSAVVLPSSVVLSASSGFIPSGQSILCTTVEARYYLCLVSINYNPPTPNPDDSNSVVPQVYFYIAKNGVPVVSSGVKNSSTVSCVIELQDGDEVSIRSRVVGSSISNSNTVPVLGASYTIFGN